MQLNMSFFIVFFMVLLNNLSILARPSSVLYDKITLEDVFYVRQSKYFLIPATLTVELSKEDKALIEKVVSVYRVSRNTIVNFDCPDKNCASMGYARLLDDPKPLPCLSLSSSWKKLPYKQKEFVLAHEMAHFVLGHLEINHDEYITNLSKINEDMTIKFSCFGFFGMLSVIFFACEHRKTIHVYKWVLLSTITGVCACMYGVSSTSLRRNQEREKEADIKAVTVLGNAQGGIEFFTDKYNKIEYGERFFEDQCGLSSHPSHYVRLCHLQEWQANQAKKQDVL